MRRRNDTAVSLFAFQDVMASVIGVLFIVVLLMSLDMVNRASATTGSQPTASTVEALRVEAQRLRQEVLQASDALAGQSAEALRISAFDDRAVLDEIVSLDRTLRSIYARIEAEQRELSAQNDALQSSTTQKKALSERLARAKAEKEDLKSKLAAEGNGPRVAYIIDDRADALSPWLAEVSAKTVRVALAKDPSSVMEFAGEDGGVQRFVEWARHQDRTRYYFVIIVKPSGDKQVGKVEKGLDDIGFELGRDLVPEDWQSF